MWQKNKLNNPIQTHNSIISKKEGTEYAFICRAISIGYSECAKNKQDKKKNICVIQVLTQYLINLIDTKKIIYILIISLLEIRILTQYLINLYPKNSIRNPK